MIVRFFDRPRCVYTLAEYSDPGEQPLQIGHALQLLLNAVVCFSLQLSPAFEERRRWRFQRQRPCLLEGFKTSGRAGLHLIASALRCPDFGFFSIKS